MSFVGAPFEHDIFVTYSHGSDAQGEGYLREWSRTFARELERELRVDRDLRDRLRIFMDADHRTEQGVDPMAPLTAQLRDEIGVAALLVVLMSPDYLLSQWCADERDWWHSQQHEPDLATAQRVPIELTPQQRIAVVRIWPTEGATWPPLLLDESGAELVGFPFHANYSGQWRPLGWFDEPKDKFSGGVRLAMMALVGRLYERLRHIKGRLDKLQSRRDEAARLAQAAGQTLYLHARAEHAKVWEAAADKLGSQGFVVLPGAPDPVERDPEKLQRARKRRVEALGNCDALLLVGTEDGGALDEDMVVVGKHDRQLARSLTNKLLPCGLLDTVGEPVATRTRRQNARILQTHWLDATRPDWPSALPPWLAEQGAEMERRA